MPTATTIGGGGPPTFGISWVDDGPLRLTAGRAPDGPGPGGNGRRAPPAKHGYHVGDRVRVLLSGAAKRYEIVGLFGYGDATDLGAVTVAAFDLAAPRARVRRRRYRSTRCTCSDDWM